MEGQIGLGQPAGERHPGSLTATIDYGVVVAKRAATPVRFDETVAARLASFARRHPGMSLSGAVNLLVDEGLRTLEHPGIVFREGPTGRRAGLAGGPDVWEVVRALRSARSAEPERDDDGVLALAADHAGLSLRAVQAALGYWASYPEEIEAELDDADHAEGAVELAWRRKRDLLAR